MVEEDKIGLDPTSVEIQALSPELAKKTLGKDFMGPKEVREAFYLENEFSNVPPIPFNESDLEEAKKYGQCLIYYSDEMDGRPITIKNIADQLGGTYIDGGRIINYSNNGESYTELETPKKGWALVGKEIFPETKGVAFIEQTDIIIEHLRNITFKDKPIPNSYQEAFNEYENSKTEIINLMGTDMQKAVELLKNLQIVTLTRQTAVESLYFLAVCAQATDEHYLSRGFNLTSSTSSHGIFIRIGDYFKQSGTDIFSSSPKESSINVGTVFARRS